MEAAEPTHYSRIEEGAFAYTICRRPGCWFFVEELADNEQSYTHLDDGEQDHDHEAYPGQVMLLEQWKAVEPALFREFPDGKTGPNSTHFADARALDHLARILSRPTWPGVADFLDTCNSIVRDTGRATS